MTRTDGAAADEGTNSDFEFDMLKNHEYIGKEAPMIPFPREIQMRVERLSWQVILPHSPPVLFLPPPNNQIMDDHDDFWPTDFLGAYFPGGAERTGIQTCHYHGEDERRIEIYPRRIAACAKQLGLKEDVITQIVLIHEIQHALFHMGCTEREYRRVVDPEKVPTNYSAFFRERHSIWCEYSSELLELQAQLGTWHIVHNHNDLFAGEIEDAFLNLMEHQPKDYVLSKRLRETGMERLWVYMRLSRDSEYRENLEGPEALIQYVCADTALSDTMFLSEVGPVSDVF